MLDEANHVTREQLTLLAQDRLPALERQKVLRHLLSRCEPCLNLAREIACPERSSPDYSGVLRRLELAYVVAQGEIEAERKYAAHIWETLLSKLDSGSRLRALRDSPNLQTWGIFNHLLEQAKRAAVVNPFEAIDLVHAAVAVSELLPVEAYGEERIYDYRASAYAALGNVKRLAGDFQGAKSALLTGQEMAEKGTGDPYEEANLISITASLKTDLGMLEEAGEMLCGAIALSHRVNDPVLEAKLRIQQSSCIGWLDPGRALDLAYDALSLLRKARSDDKYLELGGLYLTAYWSNELDQVEDARATLETYKYLFSMYPDPVTQGRLLILDALISRKEGRLDYSERLFRQLVELYAEHQMEFDLALASLEWAESLVLLRRFDEATDVMSSVYPAIASWNIHIDILRSWVIVKEAVRGRAVEESAFRELAMTLRRKWYRKGNGVGNS